VQAVETELTRSRQATVVAVEALDATRKAMAKQKEELVRRRYWDEYSPCRAILPCPIKGTSHIAICKREALMVSKMTELSECRI